MKTMWAAFAATPFFCLRLLTTVIDLERITGVLGNTSQLVFFICEWPIWLFGAVYID
jgi:hypothetical protein